MKKMKKIIALALTLVMMLSMSMTVFAAPEEVALSVPAGDSHTYEVYQIFTGDLAGKVLSDVHYGANASIPTGKKAGDTVETSVLNTIKGISGTDAEKAEVLKTYANLTSDPFTTVSAGSSVNVPTGYYLIKDNNVDLAVGDEHTLYILAVVGPTEITRKAGTTSSDKKVDDTNDSDTTEVDNGQLQTSSDYDIGDKVPYHVTATISDKVEQYEKYHITLEDILETGKFDDITLDKENAIKLGSDTIADTENYTVTTTWITDPSKDGFKVKIEFTPKEGKTLESLAGKTIAIDFTATLGENAAIGEEGNKNTLKVSYSNNPNESDGGSEGHTPDKEVITFTYKVVIDKFNNENQPLEGAGFTLYKVSKADAEANVIGKDAAAKNTAWANKAITTWTTNAIDGETVGTKNRFSFNGIDDGYYVLCETTTPAGYNTLEPQVFKVTATHDANGLELTDLSGNCVSGEITFTPNKSTGALSANVINNQGTILPETGGIGTTIFYVVGAILMIGAGVMLVTRKRISK
ncbi:SpaH/EbpB family LPXTG-anchored major pilin [Roseburia hominis]